MKKNIYYYYKKNPTEEVFLKPIDIKFYRTILNIMHCLFSYLKGLVSYLQIKQLKT